MKIELPAEIDRRLRQALRQAGRQEIGGMLFAEQLAPGHFRLADFSLDAFSGSHTSFQRKPEAHQGALDAFFAKTGRDYRRFNYLGEWHSHPSFSVSPSTEDVATMQSLVDSPDSAISFALLLVVRLRLRFWIDYSLTSFARGYVPRGARFAARLI